MLVKTQKPFFIILSLCFMVNIAFSMTLDVDVKIKDIVQKYDNNANFGILIKDLKAGTTIYSHRQNELFIPASILKLFTTVAALHQLGPDHKFKTILYRNNNDIAIKFTGDHSLTTAKLSELFAKITNKNINNIIIDTTTFTGPLRANGWIINDNNWYFSGPVSAAVIDSNTETFIIKPGSTINSNAIVTKYSDNKAIKLKNSNIITVTEEDSENLCQLETHVNNKNELNMKGCWSIDMHAYKLSIAVQNVNKYLRDKLQFICKQKQIKINGSIKFAQITTDMQELATIYSEPLAQINRKILSESNNMYAESILKILGYNFVKSGSFKTGTFAVKNIISKLCDIDIKQLKIVDGSGNSRENLLTPLQITKLLETVYENMQLRKYIFEALAVSGSRGNLKSRFRNSHLAGKLVAKTGTMNGTSGIAGFLSTQKNKDLIVVILINNSLLTRTKLNTLQDDIVNYLYTTL